MTVASSARRCYGPKRSRPESDLTLILEDLCLGHTVADVMVTLGSVDIVMGEVDR
jgi:NADH-quinone oxidoreductase subunit D